MGAKVCRFFSSTLGLVSVVCGIMCVFVPIDWWLKLILAVTFIPLVIWSNIRFFGNQQLWDWGCDSKENKRKK